MLSHRLLFVTPMDCGPPGSSVHGIFQARILSGLPLSTPGDLPDPGIKPASLVSPTLADMFFTTSATWEAPFSTTVVEWQQVRVKWICNQNLELSFQISVSSECILSLLLLFSQQRFEKRSQSYSSLTAQNFIKQTADNTLQEMRAVQPWKSPTNSSWLPLFIIFVSSPGAYMMLTRACTHHQPGRRHVHFLIPLEVPTLVLNFLLCSLV